MRADIVDRLRLDPGQRTLGQLLQDREAALQEIRRLRSDIERLRAMRTRAPAKPETRDQETSDSVLRTGSLVSIKDLCALLKVSRSTIYKWVSEGDFPPPVRISKHSIRWKAEDVAQWRRSLEVSPL